MVTKSANYCHTSVADSVGLMLLCEVALGEMYGCCSVCCRMYDILISSIVGMKGPKLSMSRNFQPESTVLKVA